MELNCRFYALSLLPAFHRPSLTTVTFSLTGYCQSPSLATHKMMPTPHKRYPEFVIQHRTGPMSDRHWPCSTLRFLLKMDHISSGLAPVQLRSRMHRGHHGML